MKTENSELCHHNPALNAAAPSVPEYPTKILNVDNSMLVAGRELIFQNYRKVLLELLGQFDQAHTALGVDRSPSAQNAIDNAKALLNIKED